MAEISRKRSLCASSLLLVAAAIVLLNAFDISKVADSRRDLLSDDEAPDSNNDKHQRSSCNCTLITSPGGVGSTQFIQLLIKYTKTAKNDACVNHFYDFDGTKHLPATSFEYHDGTSISHNGHCFSNVLVIVGDPVHSIASTYRRHHKTDHLNKLRKHSGKDPYDKETITLDDIFREIEVAGEDTTGIVHYLDSWLAAADNPSSWPETRIVTTKDLYNFAKANAEYVGITEERLKDFDSLHFREPERAEDASERIREIFAPIASKLEQASRRALLPYLLSKDHLLSLSV
uniref:Sulfotransferase domain-containing protein n=1 Tax=Minutocellus polymorphus TaxID=265543 RepID=A0A7S0ARB9_9STRA|eukprot:CAMPEP_0197718122 /NCGR_PEP_ID=MMETSP1434-20131217/2404_1 /TAXON_ID=265543 /ORGANISM="Minutocellus polymorphus, Strain CCMP3303" /LENGTH=288 /DNA_ID=CAMNT_0043302745 /DNA_START=97 /DNA_END=963 /DNA_ORIENTATION=-